jgi:response regulator RpfG family c-di-GMP phosphodiesterase
MKQQALIGQHLLDLGLINLSQLEAALALQKRRKERLGELLLELRFISELDILKVLAERMRIHYISSDKLSQIKIHKSVLDFLTVEFSERQNVLPLMFDQDRQVLSILANQPTDQRLIKEVSAASGAREVNAYLAMRPTIQAGIRRFYFNEIDAFNALDSEAVHQNTLLSFGSGSDSRKANLSPEDNVEGAQSSTGLRLADEVAQASLMSENLYVETLNILISLLEMRSGNFRGHSAAAARLVKKISEQLDLKPKDVYFNVVAAYFHDLGKKEGIHHTLINLTTEKDLRLAQKFYLAPVRLIAAANFPRIIPEILSHLFERVDGKGFPDGLTGDRIPLGSRIISVVDAYEDLIRHPEWSKRPVTDVLTELFYYQGTCFDRQVLRALNEVIMRGRSSKGPTAAAQTVMLIDPSGTTYTDMVAQFKNAGFRMIVARDTDSAIKVLKEQKIDAILSELNTQPLSGYQLCTALKSNPASKSILFMFISSIDENGRTIQSAFDAGADDFFSHPLRTDVILAKVRLALVRQKDTLTEMQAQTTPPRASVTGNLKDISLADVVQLLTNGRKTGMLHLRKGDEEAQVFITDGMVINSFYRNLKGETAFYRLLEWEEGEFALKTEVTMPEQVIHMPTQNLMLEGFRRIDESRAGR